MDEEDPSLSLRIARKISAWIYECFEVSLTNPDTGDVVEEVVKLVQDEIDAPSVPALSAKEEVEELTRKLLAQRLAMVSEKQREFFTTKVYPGKVKEQDLISAIDLCNRTIKKNIENPNRLEEK